jgi:HK97 family phage portal protein
MAFFKELIGNAGILIKQPFLNSKPISNQEATLTQLGWNSQEPFSHEAIYPQWFFSARLGQPRSIDVAKLRDFSKSAWVQMVLSTFKKQILTMPWQIVKEDEEDETDRTEDIKRVTEFFKEINDNGDSVVDINSEVITDIGEIDAGCWNYCYSMDSYDIGQIPIYDAWGRIEGYEQGLILKPFGQRELVKVKSVDGGTMLKQVDIHKNLLNFWQYSFKNPRQNPTRFSKDEINYLMLNKKSYDVYGFSPVQSIQQVLELLIQGTRYNKDLYTNNAVPDYLVSMPKLPTEALRKLKRMWNNEYKNKPHQIGFINWAIEKIQKLADSNRDLEWLDGQKWYFHIVFGVFGVSPTEAGFFENANRSNDEGQANITVRNALKPYMAIIEKGHKKTIDEFLQKKDHGLCFRFFPKDQVAEKEEFEQDVKKVEMGIMTINEFRTKEGFEPVEWGDEPLRRPFNPADGFSNFAGNPGNPNQRPNSQSQENDDDNDDMDKSFKPLKKKDELSPGDDMVEEAEGYSDFLMKTFDRIEKKVLSAADKLDITKSISKTTGEFLKDMFNVVNTKAFANQVKKFLKADLVTGMIEAEKETQMDIGFTQAFQDKLNQLQGQQVNGYTINGKRWPGIKGITKELQSKIIQSIQAGVNEGKSLEEIKAGIKSVFGGFSDWRAEMVGRTESVNIINEGLIIGYKETKIPGKKVWRAKLDNRTSLICKRLNKQERELDEPFIDPETNKSYMRPTAHVNCRCRLSFLPL